MDTAHGDHLGGEIDHFIKDHHDILSENIQVNKALLIALCGEGLLEIEDALKIQRTSTDRQTSELLKLLRERTQHGTLEHFLRSLERAGQFDLTICLTSFEREMHYVAKWHSKLARELETFIDNLVTQEKRLGMRSDVRKVQVADADVTDVISLLRSAKSLLAETVTQVSRSSTVLSKLNQERSTTTTKVTDNIAKLQECEALLRAVYPAEARRVGRAKPLMKLTDESERIMRSIRDITKECQNTSEKHRRVVIDCGSTIERLGHQIQARVAAIEKLGSVSPKPTRALTQDTPRRAARYTEDGPGCLLDDLDALEKDLKCYISHEKSLMNKLNGANLQLRLTKMHLDPDDKEFKGLEKEVQESNKSNTVGVLRTLMARVHKERKEALATLSEMEKLIESRISLIEKREGKPSPKQSPRQEKKQATPEDKDSVVWRAKKVQERIRAYADIEKGITQHYLAEFAKKKRALTTELTGMQSDIELLEEMAKRFESEKEKYKRLYDTERVVKHKDTTQKKEEVKMSRSQRRIRPDWNSRTSLQNPHRRPLPATFNQYLSEKGQLKDSRSSWEGKTGKGLQNGCHAKKESGKPHRPNKCATS